MYSKNNFSLRPLHFDASLKIWHSLFLSCSLLYFEIALIKQLMKTEMSHR